jgi:hypothetical protein
VDDFRLAVHQQIAATAEGVDPPLARSAGTRPKSTNPLCRIVPAKRVALDRTLQSRKSLRRMACGQTRGIPGSDAIRLRVMWPSTPAGRQCLAMAALHMLHSTMKTVSAPTSSSFRGSLPHPPQQLCTIRVRRHRRFTQHSLLVGPLRPSWLGLTPTDRGPALPGAFLHSIRANQAGRRDQHSFCHGLRVLQAPAFRNSKFQTEHPDPKDEP